MELKQLIKVRREERGMTQGDLAAKVGVNVSTVSRWESGDIANMRRNQIAILSKTLDISPAVIMEWPETTETERKRIPVLGRVAAGIPIDAIEEIIDYEEVDDRLASIGDLFGLRIKGDSMMPRICDGDVVIIHKQPEAQNGDTVIATINGDDAVCKRLFTYGDVILLRSNNPAYDDIDVTGREDFHIVGVVVELRAKFK